MPLPPRRRAAWRGPRSGAARGCDAQLVWGECQGSGKSAYQACVELTEPAFRCSCPSRKIPCKHTLGPLLPWSENAVKPRDRPGWVWEWLAQRQEPAKAAERRKAAAGPKVKDPKTAERREQRAVPRPCRDRAAFDAHEQQEHTKHFLSSRGLYVASYEVDWLTLQSGKGTAG